MIHPIDFLFDTSQYPARWHCGYWKPLIGWTHITSDTLIFLAYVGIPISLLYYQNKIKALELNYIFYLFAAFIFFCGTTHLIEAIIFWKPIYNFAGLIKLCTALISLATLFVIILKLPATLRFIKDQNDAKTLKLELENIKAQNAERALVESEEKNAKLREVDKLKSNFIANVSHELRTPLTLILGPLESILENTKSIPQQYNENLHRMHRNVLKLYAMVNDVLDFSKLEVGMYDLHREAVDINKVLSDMIEDAKGLATQRKITLKLSLCPELGLISLDKRMIDKIALNLISNALKFTPEKGLIEVVLKKQDSNLHLIVKDTGIGIPAEHINHLFERFYQVDASHNRKFEGTGLGLSIVHEFVTLMGGTIAVESKLNQGTTFTVVLPIKPVQNVKASSHAKSSAAENAESKSNFSVINSEEIPKPKIRPTFLRESSGLPSILICDDNNDMLSYIASLLEDSYQILTASNGKEALEVIKEYRPQVILSDIMMPIMDGYELTKAVKSSPSIKDIPIILISAKAAKEAIASGLDVGADDYLCKPFSPEELKARTASALRSYQAFLELKATQLKLFQQSKLASIGQLAAGVAHEINNPITFVKANVELLEVYYSNIKDLIDNANKVLNMIPDTQNAEFVNAKKKMESLFTNQTINTMSEEIPDILSETNDGIERVAEIVSDLKSFSHPGKSNLEKVNINDCLESTLKIITHEWKNKCNINKIYGNLPLLSCNPNQINQVFLNILVNATHAIDEKGDIIIQTKCVNNEIVIDITDSGAGIGEEYLEKLFEPFFTTKPIGKGTGLGLFISHNIVKKHNGRIEVQSKINEGTTFTIYFPLIELEEMEDDTQQAS